MKKINGCSWREIEGRDLDLLVADEDFKDILARIGYEIDETGVLIDEDTGKPVMAEDGNEINLKRNKEVVLFAGSLAFAKNIAGFSDILARHGLLKIVEKTER